ncbi:MAG: glycerol-3-phosphate 1-O-acyltransferase PlsY [Verrucomicrobiota bacterium]|nr:glycerol-3-phosphate 1-O-acyltransferase PlsY [Verrucomicrobiota bacterium]MEC8243555.1 glycerol-3-phosphate 1-O-acyltransferase PlsY [Verrucomicrobiota bacterium]
MFSLETVSVVIIGYLFGSIPFGVIVAKKMGVNIFKVGSGNPGATNVLRSIGKPAGYTVFILDFLKGVLATVWFKFGLVAFSGDPNLALWGLPAAVLGHTYPLFSNFKGGKGVATAMGGLLGVMPGCLLIGLVSWLIIFITTRYVAVASIGFGLSLPVCAIVSLWSSDDNTSQFANVVLAFLIMVWIIWRHRANLQRLKDGTENRFERKTKD